MLLDFPKALTMFPQGFFLKLKKIGTFLKHISPQLLAFLLHSEHRVCYIKCDSWRSTQCWREQNIKPSEREVHFYYAEGIDPIPAKQEAIVKAPAPRNYEFCYPLNHLLHKEVKRKWLKKCQTGQRETPIIPSSHSNLPIQQAQNTSLFWPTSFQMAASTKWVLLHGQWKRKPFHLSWRKALSLWPTTDLKPPTSILGPKPWDSFISSSQIAMVGMNIVCINYKIEFHWSLFSSHSSKKDKKISKSESTTKRKVMQ